MNLSSCFSKSNKVLFSENVKNYNRQELIKVKYIEFKSIAKSFNVNLMLRETLLLKVRGSKYTVLSDIPDNIDKEYAVSNPKENFNYMEKSMQIEIEGSEDDISKFEDYFKLNFVIS